MCAHNAVAAAFQDPRFAPLTKEEFADVIIDVALLSKPESIRFSSEHDALNAIEARLDGVTLKCDTHRATFLPHAMGGFPARARFSRTSQEPSRVTGRLLVD